MAHPMQRPRPHPHPHPRPRHNRLYCIANVCIIFCIAINLRNLTKSTRGRMKKWPLQRERKRAYNYMLDWQPYKQVPLRPGTIGYLYHNARNDGTGAFIHDMLMAHAVAFARNLTYGGVCEEDWENERKFRLLQRHEELLNELRLSHELPLSCPLPTEHTTTRIVWATRNDYNLPSAMLWTRPWRRDFESRLPAPSSSKNAARTVVIHIRRGDVDPCNGKTDFRYLPNAHYTALLRQYARPGDDIRIYSQTKSFEPWSDFENVIPAVKLMLDTPLRDVWQAMIQADVAILSKSSFSFVPALLNDKGQVVYTPFWHDPLPHWTIANATLVQESNNQLQHLKAQCENT